MVWYICSSYASPCLGRRQIRPSSSLPYSTSLPNRDRKGAGAACATPLPIGRGLVAPALSSFAKSATVMSLTHYAGEVYAWMQSFSRGWLLALHHMVRLTEDRDCGATSNRPSAGLAKQARASSGCRSRSRSWMFAASRSIPLATPRQPISLPKGRSTAA